MLRSCRFTFLWGVYDFPRNIHDLFLAAAFWRSLHIIFSTLFLGAILKQSRLHRKAIHEAVCWHSIKVATPFWRSLLHSEGICCHFEAIRAVLGCHFDGLYCILKIFAAFQRSQLHSEVLHSWKLPLTSSHRFNISPSANFRFDIVWGFQEPQRIVRIASNILSKHVLCKMRNH